MPVWWRVGTDGPNRFQLEEIAAVLKRGGVVLAPTDTIYGLHALAHDANAVERIFELKGRPADKALPVLFASLDQLRAAGADLSPDVAEVLQQIWPAPLTAILPLRHPIPASAGSTIAARVPANEWLRKLLEETGPLGSTSANRSGESPIADPQECPQEIERALDGVVDMGPVRAAASTIVDFTKVPPAVLRAGDFVFTQNLWKKSRKSL